MADITMCPGKDCPKKSTCYRFWAIPHEWQSWFAEDPRKEDGTCDQYWERTPWKEE